MEVEVRHSKVWLAKAAPSETTCPKCNAMSVLDVAGQRFNIPANGKLRIEMKDGTLHEIDLMQVKKVLVKK